MVVMIGAALTAAGPYLIGAAIDSAIDQRRHEAAHRV